MSDERTAFGIDFGTTNTRIAYFDGKRVRLVPFHHARAQFHQIPSLVRYEDGEPIAYGFDAQKGKTGRLPKKSIKWLLAKEDPVDIDGYNMEPVEMVAQFFRHLQACVEIAGIREPLCRAAFTIPVNYPSRARTNLERACEAAGIEIAGIFPEPVAALYCDLFMNRATGVAAVFDWGGGSLDVAAVRIDNNLAFVRNQDGRRVGGEHFDQMIVDQAIVKFFSDNPDSEFTPADIFRDRNRGQELRLQAEEAKIELSRSSSANLDIINLLPKRDLEFPFRVEEFKEWITPEVDQSIACLERMIWNAKSSPKGITRLLLSGGTCNIPLIKLQIEQKFGIERVVTDLSVPKSMVADAGGMDDVGNATAVGAALLSVYGAHPVFAQDVGVRLSNSSGEHDTFYPIFATGETLPSRPRKENFFVTETESGVARLLICERLDPHTQPHGRLRCIIPIPVDKNETWVKVKFTVTPSGSMIVEGTGRIASAERGETQNLIHDLNLGFKIPEARAAGRSR